MSYEELDGLRSVEELTNRQDEVRSTMARLDGDFQGIPMDEAARDEFARLKGENDEITRRVRELEARKSVLESLASRGHTEAETTEEWWNKRTERTTMKERDIFDVSTLRMDTLNPEAGMREMRDRAMRAIEISAFPQRGLDQAKVKEHLEGLVEKFEDPASRADVVRRIVATGGPTYRRGFLKYIAGIPRSPEEERVMTVGSGAAGGYAIVYQLDPTFIPNSNLSVNPYRGIARVETISGTNEFRVVTSTAVTAAYAAEDTEASDNTPTLAQPAMVTQRAQAFVPVSIELEMDLPALQSQLAQLIQDGKDDLEAAQFSTGAGTTVYPQGVLVGASTTVTSAGTAAFAVADVYTVEQNLPPRFRPRANWLANRSTYNLIRQFDTAGGAAMWLGYPNPMQGGLPNNVPAGGNTGITLNGYPTYECSGVTSTLASSNLILVIGDFSRYYCIVDRMGLDVEVIPHLFGGTNRYPTGQRGIYAMWRNTAKVIDANGFRVLTLK